MGAGQAEPGALAGKAEGLTGRARTFCLFDSVRFFFFWGGAPFLKWMGGGRMFVSSSFFCGAPFFKWMGGFVFFFWGGGGALCQVDCLINGFRGGVGGCFIGFYWGAHLLGWIVQNGNRLG